MVLILMNPKAKSPFPIQSEEGSMRIHAWTQILMSKQINENGNIALILMNPDAIFPIRSEGGSMQVHLQEPKFR